MTATSRAVDFTNVKEGRMFNKRRMPAGDYAARITKVEDAPTKEGGEFQWLFTIQVDNGGTYPHYCKLVENQLWKIRNLCLAAGLNVPKKRLKLDPEKLVGKRIAVTLEDDEYEGKKQSEVTATFPLSELDGYADSDDGVGDDADDEDEVDETPPPVKKATKKAARKPEPEPEEDEDEDEVEEEDEADEYAGLDRTQLKRRLRKAQEGISIKRNQSDDDLRALLRKLEGAGADADEDEEDDEEEAPPPKKKAKKRATRVEEVSDDDLDELDIDEI